MSTIVYSSNRNDFNYATYYYVVAGTSDRGAIITIFCFNCFNNTYKCHIKVDDTGYTFIDAFYDGELFFIARKSNLIEAYFQNGLLCWATVLPYDSNLTVENVIYTISNYSNELIICGLNDEIGDVVLVSKQDGKVQKILPTSKGVNDFFISNECKCFHASGTLYSIKKDAIHFVHEVDGFIRSVDTFYENFYIANKCQVDQLYYNKFANRIILSYGVIIELITNPEFVGILLQLHERGKYELFLCNHDLSGLRLLLKIDSDFKPIILKNTRSLITFFRDADTTFEDNFGINPRLVTF
jgi:hypothetical protein